MATKNPYTRYKLPPFLDGRRADARSYRATVRELVEHVGGHPSATQRRLIEHVAILGLHMTRMDANTFAQGAMSDHDRREYLAWSNTYRRTLDLLGLHAPATAPAALDPAHAALAARYPRPAVRQEAA